MPCSPISVRIWWRRLSTDSTVHHKRDTIGGCTHLLYVRTNFYIVSADIYTHIDSSTDQLEACWLVSYSQWWYTCDLPESCCVPDSTKQSVSTDNSITKFKNRLLDINNFAATTLISRIEKTIIVQLLSSSKLQKVFSSSSPLKLKSLFLFLSWYVCCFPNIYSSGTFEMLNFYCIIFVYRTILQYKLVPQSCVDLRRCFLRVTSAAKYISHHLVIKSDILNSSIAAVGCK